MVETSSAILSAVYCRLKWIAPLKAERTQQVKRLGILAMLAEMSAIATFGFVELTREGQLTTAVTFRPFAVYLTVAALYFLLCFPLAQWSRRLERRLHVAR